MQSRARSLVVAPLFVALLGLGLASARQDDAKVERSPVAGVVSVLVSEGGGNIGVSDGADGLLIVDDQFERIAPAIEAALDTKAKGAPRFLVNTHHHGDHTDGNKHFGKLATVVAHENVRTRMSGAEAPPQALPIVTFADGLSLHFNGEEIRLIHCPGAHTDGDTVVWFTGSKVVHLGDLYFQVGYPFIDVASGGSVRGIIAGVKQVLALVPADTRFVPGHGEVTGKDGLVEYLEMLETITERVQEHLAQGDDVATMLSVGVTEDFDERWGRFDFVPPRAFVESVVASLK